MTVRAWRLQLEAATYLVAARMAVRLLPFRWLTPLFERAPRRPELEGTARAVARSEVRRAIFNAARRLPGDTVCFPKAVAAQAMLRRRGVGTVLYCGASISSPDGLTAHVWVQDGEVGVSGFNASKGYSALARFPA